MGPNVTQFCKSILDYIYSGGKELAGKFKAPDTKLEVTQTLSPNTNPTTVDNSESDEPDQLQDSRFWNTEAIISPIKNQPIMVSQVENTAEKSKNDVLNTESTAPAPAPVIEKANPNGATKDINKGKQ